MFQPTSRLETIQEAAAAMRDLQRAVGRLLNAYYATEHVDLNDLQPEDMPSILPASIDEWFSALRPVVDEWQKLARESD